MTAQLGQALEQLADELTALGIPATVDPQRIKLPGAWVALRTILATRLDGTSEVEALVYLVAGDYATPAVLDELGAMLDKVSQYAADARVEAVTLSVPNYAPAGLPALAVPMFVEVSPDPDPTPPQ